MKIIEPNVEIIDICSPLERIERIGRICYKSEHKIGPGTAKQFVKMLISRRHYAMLEHAVVHYVISTDHVDRLVGVPGVIVSPSTLATRPAHDEWLVTVSVSHLYNPQYCNMWPFWEMRELFDYKYEMDEVSDTPRFSELRMVDDLTEYDSVATKHELISMCFTCDRGVSHELVRHRCAVAQESTRYCNYADDRFGKEIRVVLPSTYSNWDENSKSCWRIATDAAEKAYLDMVENGRRPQEARSVLNNSLATQVVLSMTAPRWEHFFDLRSRGTTGAPHPDMKVVADMALKCYIDYTFH